MGDIPINLSLEKCLGATYANYPRLAVDTFYDPILKAFVGPKCLESAEKARKGGSKKPVSAGPSNAKKKTKGSSSTPGESNATDVNAVEPEFDKKFLCEKAKSGISKCRKCGQTIERETLRFGYPSPDPRGEYGCIPIWFHMRCAPVSFVGFESFDSALGGMCHGFAELSSELQEEAMTTGGKGKLKIKSRLDGRAEDDEYADEFEENLTEKLVQRRGVSVPLLDTPADLTGAVLLPFQREGFSWMMAQEANSATRGGILADEMGMGKTLQTICMIVAKRATVRPTLVVCPVAAVMQWYSEIEKFVSPANPLSIHVYHGSQKISAHKLAEFDVVLTTYQTLENDYRKESNKAKVKCSYCSKMFLPGKLSFHLKYMCGPNAMRTTKQSLRQLKDKSAAERAKQTMGITASHPPTVSNVLREVIMSSGLVDEKEVAGMSQHQLLKHYRSKEGLVDGVQKPVDTKESAKRMETSDSDGDLVDDRSQLLTQPIAKLREELRRRGVDAAGKKVDLVDRLISHKQEEHGPLVKPGLKRRVSQITKKSEGKSEGKSEVSKVRRTSVDIPASSRPVRSTRKPTVKESVSSDSSASSAVSSDSSASSCDDSLASSSGSTLDVDSDSSVESESAESESADSESVVSETPPRRRRGSVKSQSGSAKLKQTLGSSSHESSDENSVEDIDLNKSPLHSVQWGRLVLDEAHRIKQHTNSTSLAAFAIAAEFRWCLSGTPLQNRIGELFSLVRFLRFSPFAHYFCKGCDCKSLHFRFVDNRFCQKCNCARTKHYSYFKQVISGPIVKFGIGDGVALNVLKTQVLDSILLRRTKLERQADLNLPSMSVEIRKIQLSPSEFDFYESIYKQSLLRFDTFAKSGTLLHNYAHIFDLLTRLRQALDHPYLIVYGADYTVPTAEVGKELLRGVCSLCQDDVAADEPRAVANCGHKFHSDCVREYIREAPQLALGGTGCPACFVPLTLKFEDNDDQTKTPSEEAPAEMSTTASTPLMSPIRKVKDTILERVGANAFQSSTKIEAVVEEVLKLGPESKVLIFSQFTRMLDLVEFRIKQSGIACAKLTGALNLTQRSNIILSFNADPNLKALLISLKAGGEGLNLQAADHVFLLDPWWNPACELQAIQRAHRIGQIRPVKAVRIVTENTVEEKVVALQEMKQLVFDATVGQSQGAEKKLTESDLRFLFNH